MPAQLNAPVWPQDHQIVTQMQPSLLLLCVASPVTLFFQLLSFASEVSIVQDRFEQLH
jgi:hypothetical protein